MSKQVFQILRAGKASICVLTVGMAIAAAPVAALAQTQLASAGNLGSAPGIAIAVGNGIQEGHTVAKANTSSRSPAIGVGVLSGQPDHNGSFATLSVLNSDRLLGVQSGPNGSAGPGVTVVNSSHQPVASRLGH